MPRSLLRQLLLIWMVIVAACLGVAMMLYGLYRQTEGVRLEEARQQLSDQCARIVQRYAGASEAARSGDDGVGLAAVVVHLVLADAPGVEGGVWDLHKGFVAYAYPTYDGSDHKTDIPDAEWTNIVSTAQQSVSEKKATQYRRNGRREVLLISACPLASNSAAWTMTRVPASKADAWRPLVIGMLLIFAMVAMSAIALGVLVRRWSQRLQRIQQALAADTETPHIPPTGTPELDRLGAAVNDYAQRNAQALAQTRRLADELSRHERLAALGRMTATVAHEIRNPIATMRLALENEIARRDATPDDAAHGELMLGRSVAGWRGRKPARHGAADSPATGDGGGAGLADGPAGAEPGAARYTAAPLAAAGRAAALDIRSAATRACGAQPVAQCRAACRSRQRGHPASGRHGGHTTTADLQPWRSDR